MNTMNEAEKRRYLSMLRSYMIRQRAGAGVTRRDFLKGATTGALALGAASVGGSLITGCGGGGSSSNALPMPAGTRLLLSTFLAGTVEVLDATTGAKISTLFNKDPLFPDTKDTTTTTAGVRRGPGNRVYVFSPGSNRFFILDVNTGKVTREVKSSITMTPHSGVIGPDGNLYVVNAPSLTNTLGIGPDSVEIYTPDGDHIRTFIDGNTTPEMRAPFGIAWGPDGNLYISSTLAYFPFALGSDYVSRFDGTTGKFAGYIAKDVKVPFNINFHPDGYLMVIEHFYSRVDMYDLRTGRVVDAFASADFCIDIQFGPDRNAYMTSFTDKAGIEALFASNTDAAKGKGRILRYDGSTGKSMGTLAENLVFSGYISFV